jgi:hypothetical protein
MKNILKKTCGLLVLLGLFLSFAQLALADDTTVCGSTFADKKAAGEAMKGENGTDSYTLSELNEPISDFDEVLTDANGVEVSRVFTKYKCEGDSKWAYVKYTSDGSCPTDAEYCTYVQLIYSQSGTGLLKTYIAILYRWAAGIVGIISVLVIVISGIQISADQGSGEAVGSAKNRIMQSLAGLVILFLSALILYTINPTFFN